MVIVSWNCNGAFRRKWSYLLNFNCDVLIIQECENPDEVSYPKEFFEFMPNFIWIGDNKSRGLGVFSRYKLYNNLWDCGGTKYFISCKVNTEFDLLGVWCHHANSPTFRYIGQMWKYMQINKYNMRNKDILVGGDFNSNTIWDVWDRWWNHSDVFRELEDLDIKSLYHEFFNEEQGKETIPTFYHQKKVNKFYHIDYVLGSKRFYKTCSRFKVGELEEFLEVSDHMPIFVHFD